MNSKELIKTIITKSLQSQDEYLRFLTTLIQNLKGQDYHQFASEIEEIRDKNVKLRRNNPWEFCPDKTCTEEKDKCKEHKGDK